MYVISMGMFSMRHQVRQLVFWSMYCSATSCVHMVAMVLLPRLYSMTAPAFGFPMLAVRNGICTSSIFSCDEPTNVENAVRQSPWANWTFLCAKCPNDHSSPLG